jgi:hypothetical protein
VGDGGIVGGDDDCAALLAETVEEIDDDPAGFVDVE